MLLSKRCRAVSVCTGNLKACHAKTSARLSDEWHLDHACEPQAARQMVVQEARALLNAAAAGASAGQKLMVVVDDNMHYRCATYQHSTKNLKYQVK